jgi:hypothetical protein
MWQLAVAGVEVLLHHCQQMVQEGPLAAAALAAAAAAKARPYTLLGREPLSLGPQYHSMPLPILQGLEVQQLMEQQHLQHCL